MLDCGHLWLIIDYFLRRISFDIVIWFDDCCGYLYQRFSSTWNECLWQAPRWCISEFIRIEQLNLIESDFNLISMNSLSQWWNKRKKYIHIDREMVTSDKNNRLLKCSNRQSGQKPNHNPTIANYSVSLLIEINFNDYANILNQYSFTRLVKVLIIDRIRIKWTAMSVWGNLFTKHLKLLHAWLWLIFPSTSQKELITTRRKLFDSCKILLN